MGIGRGRYRQLPAQRGRDHPAGRSARQYALVRQGSDAAVQAGPGGATLYRGSCRGGGSTLMPVLGTLDIAQWAAGGVSSFDPWDGDAWVLKNAELLAVSIEIQPVARALLPPGMHPSVPMYAVFSVARFPESPVGPFKMAQVLISGRVGIRPRGFALKTLVNNEAARRELALRWGYPVAPGET